MTQPTIHLDTLSENEMRQSFKKLFFDKFKQIEFQRSLSTYEVDLKCQPQISWTTSFIN